MFDRHHRLRFTLLALSALIVPAWAGPSLPEGFVYLGSVAPSIRQDIRYYHRENFLGTRAFGYEAPRCILTRPAAEALARAQQELEPQGLSLKVFDCYRPRRAVAHFMRWAHQADDPALRALYYPRLDKQQLLREVYIADKSGHSRGSTVDLTIVWVRTPTAPFTAAGGKKKTIAFPRLQKKLGESTEVGHDGCGIEAARRGNALDMGSGFDCFDPVSNTDSPRVSKTQRANRELLKRLMLRHGFRNYEREWWHYTFNREPFPDQYFDFPVR